MIESDENYDDYTEDDDWFDDDDDREPDPEDYEIARSYAEHAEHCEDKHGGGECDCRPTMLDRLRWKAERLRWDLRSAPARIRFWSWRPRTIRLGRTEVAVRLNARDGCGACHGRGWFYSKTGLDPVPMPPGYDGVSLCGCGTAIGKLADARRVVRQARNEPPF